MSRAVKFVIIALMLWAIVSPSVSVSAQAFSLLPEKGDKLISQACIDCGACTVCDLLSVLSKGMRFLLGVSGALALALFLWGAFTLLTSGGKAEAVEKGKKILTGTTIGLVIILLLSWVWPRWIVIALKGLPEGANDPTIFNDTWWDTPCRKANLPAQECIGKPAGQPIQGAVGPCVKLVNNVPKSTPEFGECDPKYACGSGKSCVCDSVHRCVEGCTDDRSCVVRIEEFNFCKREGDKKPGVCMLIKPGDSCQSGRCPLEYDQSEFFGPSGPGGSGTVVEKVSPLYCDKGTSTCLIKNGGYCGNFERACGDSTVCLPNKRCGLRQSGEKCGIDCAVLCPNNGFRGVACVEKDDSSCQLGKCLCYQRITVVGVTNDVLIGKCK